MSPTKKQGQQRGPTDATTFPAATADHAPTLTGEQLRVLHQVYGITLARGKPAGTQ